MLKYLRPFLLLSPLLAIAAMIQTVVYNYLSRNWEEHKKRLQFGATREGVTPEEMFMKLSSEDK